MAKRRRLETPSSADLNRIEEEFRSETPDRPPGLRGIAPIAQIAADSAAQSQAESADARDARHLETRQGTALLILQRTTFNDLGAITTVRLAFHPGYQLIATP